MNAKLVVALILTLQVSLSLCEIPTPSSELLVKYNEHKNTFISRLWNIYRKVELTLSPEDIKCVENLQEKPMVQALVSIVFDLSQELSPVVEKGRLALLSLYESHLRPTHGATLDEFLTDMKPVLDKHFPAVNQ